MWHEELLGRMSGSQICGTAEAGKDFSHPRMVPIAKRYAEDMPASGPRPASEHAVPLVEIRYGIAFVRKSGKSRVRLKPGGGPLPHVAEHILTTRGAAAGRVLIYCGGVPAVGVVVA